ncbi:MAG: lysylphosphatidylglycerol synthase domain-containing protein [Frankiaceae bacterium]
MTHPTGSATVTPAVADPDPVERKWRSRIRRVLSALLSLVITVGIFYYLLKQFADVSSVWASIRAMTKLELGSLVLAAVWNLLTYGFVMVATMPGLTYAQAMVVTESSTAVSNTVPAGGAIGIGMNFAMYTSWGFSRSRATVSLLLSGIWNNFAKLGLPVLALALVALQGSPSGGRLIAGVAGLVALAGAITVFALMLRSAESARAFGMLAGRGVSALLRLGNRPPVRGWELATTKFRARTILLLRARWHWLTAATLISHLSLYLVLLLALRHVGVSQSQVGWAEVLAVFCFARLVTAIPITPGGVGIVELALIGGLVAAGGDRVKVTAAVLVFRALTYVLPIPLGLGTYLFWRGNTSWRRAPGMAPRTELVPESVPTGAADADSVDPPQSAAAPAAAAPMRQRRAPTVRRRQDAGWLVLATAALLLTALGVHQYSIAGWERGIFRLFNDPTWVPFAVVWPVMQIGNIVAVPVTAAVAAVARHFRLAGGILLGGGGVYYLAKVVKHVVTRGRPPTLLSGVHIHGTAAQGLGYVSGHAAVVGLIATVALPYLRRWWRWAVCAIAVAVCLARMYVGAHLPLDVAGGAALGVAVGAAIRLLLGRPT